MTNNKTLAPMQLPPSPQTDNYVVIPPEYVALISQVLYSKIPSEIVGVINSALMVIRPLAYIRYGHEISGDVLDIIKSMLAEIITEMEGKALAITLDTQHRPNGWQLTAADTTAYAGCPIFISPDSTLVALDSSVAATSLGDLRQDGIGQDGVNEAFANLADQDVSDTSLHTGQ